MISVSLDPVSRKALLKNLSLYQRSLVPDATVKALNKTGPRVVTRSRRELAAVKGVQQKAIKDQIQSYPASKRHTATKIWVGLRKWVQQSGKVKPPHRPFEATMPTGHKGLFVRKVGGIRRTKGRPASSPPNLPIVDIERLGRNPLQPEAEQIITRVGEEQMREFFPTEFSRVLGVLAKRRLKRR